MSDEPPFHLFSAFSHLVHKANLTEKDFDNDYLFIQIRCTACRCLHHSCIAQQIGNNQCSRMTWSADWGSKRMLSWNASSAWRCPTVLTISSFKRFVAQNPHKKRPQKQDNPDLYPIRNPCAQCSFIHTNLKSRRLHHLSQGGSVKKRSVRNI